MKTRTQERFAIFRALCEIRLEVLGDRISPQQWRILKYMCEGFPPHIDPPQQFEHVKAEWSLTFEEQKKFNLSLFDYLKQLSSLLTKQEPLKANNPHFATFCIFAHHHYDYVVRQQPLWWEESEKRWLNDLDGYESFKAMYDDLVFCESKRVCDFVARLDDDAKKLVYKMQRLKTKESLPEATAEATTPRALAT